MSGILSVVAVVSRMESSNISAGTSSSVWPTMHAPFTVTSAAISCRVKLTRNPGIDSILSSVPPMWPRHRPDMFGTCTDINYTVSQKKCAKFETVRLKIIKIDFDDIWQKYTKYSKIEFACFSFHVGLLFCQLHISAKCHQNWSL